LPPVNWPDSGSFHLYGLDNKILSASLLVGSAPLGHTSEFDAAAGLRRHTITVPKAAPDPYVSVIALTMEGDVSMEQAYLQQNDGSVIDGVHYKDITMEKTFVPIFMKVSDVARVPEGAYKRGAIRNITFENITATDCFSYFKNREMPCVIWGKPGSPIENIKLKNVQITAKGGHPALEASLDPEENDERVPRRVGAIPAYAWYLRHVRNIRFFNCRFGFEKNDDRPALVVDDGENVAFEQCDLKKGADCVSRVGFRNFVKADHDL
jgi:hypothetical protein